MSTRIIRLTKQQPNQNINLRAQKSTIMSTRNCTDKGTSLTCNMNEIKNGAVTRIQKTLSLANSIRLRDTEHDPLMLRPHLQKALSHEKTYTSMSKQGAMRFQFQFKNEKYLQLQAKSYNRMSTLK